MTDGTKRKRDFHGCQGRYRGTPDTALLFPFEKVKVLAVTFFLHLLDRHKTKCRGVDAITHACRLGAVVEQMPEVRIALVRANFGPFHEQRLVSLLDHIRGIDRLCEAWPACAAFKLVG